MGETEHRLVRVCEALAGETRDGTERRSIVTDHSLPHFRVSLCSLVLDDPEDGDCQREIYDQADDTAER